jgi:hypothetical protein
MPAFLLNDDEFRLVAYLRGYADRCGQRLDPGWVQEQLEWSLPQMQRAARQLAELGIVEFFEFEPPDSLLRTHPALEPGPMPCDIRLTQLGWNYLRGE